MASGQKDRPDRSGRLVGGRYRLVRKLASGGMATVYEGTHAVTLKRVAVKVLHPGVLVETQARERFFREAQAPASIEHPGIVDVTDAGVDDDGSLFLVMELLEGHSFGKLLSQPGVARLEAVRIICEMLDPLAAAHERGFVHRDLKPDNVFVAEDSRGGRRVLLLDFGIARASASHLTRTRAFMGTFGYAAPEQARNPQDATAASDVWAAGVMLYRALSGKLPFRGDGVEIVMHATNEAHAPLDSVDPTIPIRLARLVDRCLYKDPADRPKDARVLYEELSAVLSDESVTSGLRGAVPSSLGARSTARIAAASTLPPAGHEPATEPGDPLDHESTAMVIEPEPIPTLDGDLTEVATPTLSLPTTVAAEGRVAARAKRRAVPVVAIAVLATILAVIWALTGPGQRGADTEPLTEVGASATGTEQEATTRAATETVTEAEARRETDPSATVDSSPPAQPPEAVGPVPAATSERRARARPRARPRAPRRAAPMNGEPAKADVRYGPNMAPILR